MLQTSFLPIAAPFLSVPFSCIFLTSYDIMTIYMYHGLNQWLFKLCVTKQQGVLFVSCKAICFEFCAFNICAVALARALL